MIIGVTGTNGAGKGTVVDYLVEQKGFTHYSLRDAITEEIVRRGLEVNRPNMKKVGTELREQEGAAYFTEYFLKRAAEQGIVNIILDSIRAVAEAENVKSHGGYILAVDAPRHLRYDRIMQRGSSTDAVSFEQFSEEEDQEMSPNDANDPSQMNMRAVIDGADAVVINDGTLDVLHERIESALRTFA